MDFDESRLYFSHQQLQVQHLYNSNNGDDGTGDGMDTAATDANGDDEECDLDAVRRHFREFMRK
jgi:hypothetical protein